MIQNKEEIAKGHVKYKCGHESDGVLILDSNEYARRSILLPL